MKISNSYSKSETNLMEPGKKNAKSSALLKFLTYDPIEISL